MARQCGQASQSGVPGRPSRTASDMDAPSSDGGWGRTSVRRAPAVELPGDGVLRRSPLRFVVRFDKWAQVRTDAVEFPQSTSPAHRLRGIDPEVDGVQVYVAQGIEGAPFDSQLVRQRCGV